MNDSLKLYLEERLHAAHNRTYLWVYLVFDYLENEVIKKTQKEVKAKIETLPRSVNEAYDNILSKTKEDKVIHKALSIILTAKRPLTVAEMNVAMSLDFNSHSMDDLDLENDDDFEKSLRFRCGLFVSVHHGRIYLLHQTAREFLLADSTPPTDVSSHLRWHRSITFQGANSVLAVVCALALTIWESEDDEVRIIDEFRFKDYSVANWGDHFREADFQNDAAIIPFALSLCDPASKSYGHWKKIELSKIVDNSAYKSAKPTCFDDLMIISYYGHKVLAKMLLHKCFGTSHVHELGWPLMLAIEKGHWSIADILIDDRVDVKLQDAGPIIHRALVKDDACCVRLILKRFAAIDTKTQHEQLAQALLVKAVSCKSKEIVQMLLDYGVDVETRTRSGRTILARAAQLDYPDIVKILLDKVRTL